MGACSFEKSIKATSPREGFDQLVREANYYDGHDCYNGSINTTSLIKTVKIADKNSEAAAKKAIKWIDDNLNTITKRSCVCLDLGVVEYVTHKTEKKTFTPERPKMKFRVFDTFSVNTGKSFTTLAEARKYGAKLAAEGKSYHITKAYGEAEVERVTTKEVRSNRKSKDAKEVHYYTYVGWASC